jgi:hypothetical protein
MVAVGDSSEPQAMNRFTPLVCRKPEAGKRQPAFLFGFRNNNAFAVEVVLFPD